MPDYEWKTDFPEPGPTATEEDVARVEARLGVRFPEALRDGYKTAGMASIFKRGKLCAWGATGPLAEGGRPLGFMLELDPLDQVEREVRSIAEYVADLYERPLPDVVPIAQLPFGGWTCLNYQNDPTRANPEVWEGDMEDNLTFEDFFHKIADTFDAFIEMLLPDDELEAMGF